MCFKELAHAIMEAWLVQNMHKISRAALLGTQEV